MTETEVGDITETAGGDGSVAVGRWLLAAALLVLNLVDVVLTKQVLAMGGAEMNPVMRPIMDDAASPFVVKSLIALFVGVLLLACPRTSKFPERAMAVVLVVYGVVAAWNLGVLLQAHVR